jgi:hypothetical protein
MQLKETVSVSFSLRLRIQSEKGCLSSHVPKLFRILANPVGRSPARMPHAFRRDFEDYQEYMTEDTFVRSTVYEAIGERSVPIVLIHSTPRLASVILPLCTGESSTRYFRLLVNKFVGMHLKQPICLAWG